MRGLDALELWRKCCLNVVVRILKLSGAKTNNVSGKAEWMPCPDVTTEYPGLAYICPLDEIFIAEVRDALHDVIGDRAKISYTIFNKLGQKIFIAVLEKHWKKFTIKIYNIYGNEVIEVKRLFTFCLNKIKVWAPPGHFVGSIEQILFNKYCVKNSNGESILKLRSEYIKPLGLLYPISYIYGIQPIGGISKNTCSWLGLDVKSFGISFPVQLDVKDKAVLIGACFLIGCLKY